MDWILGIASNLSKFLSLPIVIMILLMMGPSAFLRGADDNLLPLSILSIKSPELSAVESTEIQNKLGLKIGTPINLKRIDEGIRSIVEKGRVQSLMLNAIRSAKGLDLVVEVELARKLRTINISEVSPEIQNEIQLTLLNIPLGKILDRGSVAILKQAIKSAYEARGYFFVEVETVVKRIPDTEMVDLLVKVKQGAPTLVTRVKLSNVGKEQSNDFRRAVTLKAGSLFTRMALENAISGLNEYFVNNQYPDSKVDETNLNFNEDKTKVEIEFVLKVGKKYQFIFIGNTVFTSDIIREWITSDVLGQPDTIHFIEGLIMEKYRAVGHHFSKVSSQSQKSEGDRVQNFSFQIEEGPRVIIDSLVVTGASEIGVDRFKQLFFDRAVGVLKRGVLWESGLLQTCRNMITELGEEGFLRVSLPIPRLSFHNDKKGVDLIFDVELGSKTLVSRVDIQGVGENRRKQLEPLLLLRAKDPVNRALLEKTKDKISNHYRQEGFTEVKFANTDEIIFGDDPSRAIVRISIEEGPQFFVGAITIEGNRFTKTEVISREIKIKPGEKYNLEKLRQSEDELLLTGLFSRVEIIGTVDPKDTSKKDIKVVVIETKAGNGELGLGAVYEDPRFRIRSFVGVAYKNLLGLNQTASARTEVGLPLNQKFERVPFVEYSAILGYRAPYPFEVPIVFFSQASLDNYEVGTSSGGGISNLQTRARIEERIEKKFSPYFTFIYRLHRFEHATTKTLVLLASNDPNNPTNPNGLNYDPGYPPAIEIVDIGSTGPGFQLDFRDDSFNPTLGSFHTLDGELAHSALFSSKDVGFYLWMSRNSFYVPLLEPFGLALFAGAGYADSLDSQKQIPNARLLTDLSLGGQGSIRGFSPRIFNPQQESVSTGFYNVRGELRTALWEDLGAAIFIDSGQIFSKTAGAQWVTGTRHDGIGMGLRYKTPVGPAVIDISQGIGPDKESIKFNFSIGVF